MKLSLSRFFSFDPSVRLDPAGSIREWKAHLLKPVDGASLAAFRILFGVILFWEVLRYFEHGWIERYFITPTFHFTYPLFDFVKPWPGNGMYVHFAVMGVLALLIAVGLFYRVACLVFFLAFSYVFLIDKTYYLNHFYLIALFSLLMWIIPAHRSASLDRRLFFKEQPPVVPYWSVFLLRAQVFIVYFYGGLAKLNPDWVQGEPMRMWLAERTEFPVIGSFFTSEWVVHLFAYGGLLFDLGIGFLLVWRRTRTVGFVLAGAFHLLNSRLFQIGIFPFLMFGATLIFAEPNWPRRVMRNIRLLFGRFPTDGDDPLRAQVSGQADTPLTNRRSTPLLLTFVHVYLLAQLLIPLRHLSYPGDVSWTEEGHRFAWHMKLRDKEAALRIYISDPKTGQIWEISPAVDLSRRQVEEMSARPDMVLQYAHYLADRLNTAGQPRPIIRVDQQVSLNGRPYQHLIDPTVNLAEVPVSFAPADWILPLNVPLAVDQQAAR
jgi:hypothetical protein